MSDHKFKQSKIMIPVLFAALAVLMLLSLLIGRYPVSAGEAFHIVFVSPFVEQAATEDTRWIVVQILRLPRILLATMAGLGRAMAGGAMQGVFRNPLVGPEILGVSSGAAFGGVLAIFLGFGELPQIAASAFAFGCLALVLAFILAGAARQHGVIGLVLAGLIIGGFFGSATGLLTYMADPETKLPNIVYWLMGSFAAATYDQVAFMAAVSLVAMPPLLGLSWRINILSLGDADAKALGVKINFLRWLIVVLVSLVVAAQVAVSGGVGWVGLIMPHLARMLVGPDHVKLLPVSSLLGGIYLLLMDDLARSLTGGEIPIGLLTSMIGTPVFAFFFIKLHGKGWSND
ncbi:MAG: iron ABC transporter permease [Candidatus Adiutrix sp.]|nr:iron ABC transporter permease [Candidatus Adiutrix sp.]